MDTVMIEARNKSDVRFLMDFSKRMGAKARIIDTEEMEDKILLGLMEEGLKTTSVSRAEVMKALKR